MRNDLSDQTQVLITHIKYTLCLNSFVHMNEPFIHICGNEMRLKEKERERESK